MYYRTLNIHLNRTIIIFYLFQKLILNGNIAIELLSKPNTPFERLFNMTVFGFICLFKFQRKWIIVHEVIVKLVNNCTLSAMIQLIRILLITILHIQYTISHISYHMDVSTLCGHCIQTIIDKSLLIQK